MVVDYRRVLERAITLGWTGGKPSAAVEALIQSPAIVEITLGDTGGGGDLSGSEWPPAAVCDLMTPGLGLLGPDDGGRTLHTLRRQFIEQLGEDYLVCALGVMERLDPTDIGRVLAIINGLATDRLLLTISHQPSPHFNLLHHALLPLKSWLALFSAAGFECLQADSLALEGDVDAADQSCGEEWRLCNVFGVADGASCLLLHKVRTVGQTFAIQLGSLSHRLIADPWRPLVRSAMDRPACGVFLVTCLQEYYILAPVMAALGGERCVVLLCDIAVQNFSVARRGLIESRLVAQGGEVWSNPGMAAEPWTLPWREWKARGGVLFSVAESTTWIGHMIGMGMVAAAQAENLETFVLQHGIMVERPNLPLTYQSGCLLSWAPGFAAFLGETVRPESSLPLQTGGFLDDTRVVVTGAPKFDLLDHRFDGDAVFTFGRRAGGHHRIVLLATNLHWGAHRVTLDSFAEDLRTLCRADPETLFILKPHPSDSLPLCFWPDRVPENMLIVTDNVLLMLGLPVEWLVQVCDMVVSTLSTLLLEAVLADKPVVLLHSDNIHGYHGLRAVEMSALVGRLDEHALRGGALAAFAAAYYDPSVVGDSTVRMFEAVAAGGSRRSPRDVIAILALASTLARYS